MLPTPRPESGPPHAVRRSHGILGLTPSLITFEKATPHHAVHPPRTRRAFRPFFVEFERLQLLDASQGMMPLPLTATAPTDPQALINRLPLVPSTSTDPSSNLDLSANVPASTMTAADSPALPSTSSMLTTDATDVSAGSLPSMALAPTATLESYAPSYSTEFTSNPVNTSAPVTNASSDPSSGSSIQPKPAPVVGTTTDPNNSTVTVTDAAGDTETETVSYTVNPDGTFSYDLILSYSTGTVSDPSAASPTNGASGMFEFSVTDTANSLTIAFSESDKDSYNINETITGGSNNGTWTDSGNDSSNESDSITLNTDGTASETYSDGAHSKENFQLNDTGTASDGGTFTYADGGNTHSDDSDSGDDDSDGTDSETYDENDFGTETASIGETGAGNVVVKGSTTDTQTYDDSLPPAQPGAAAPIEITTTSDDESDNSSYSDSGTYLGAPYTVSDVESDSNKDTNTDTAGSPDHDVFSGKNSDIFKLTLSNFADTGSLSVIPYIETAPGSAPILNGMSTASGTSGPSDSLTENNTSNDTFSGTTDTVGLTVLDETSDSVGTVSDSTSGFDSSGPFDVTGSDTETEDSAAVLGPNGLTDTSDTVTSTPSNEVIQGTIPPEGYNDSAVISNEAYNGLAKAGSDAVAIVLASAMTPEKNSPMTTVGNKKPPYAPPIQPGIAPTAQQLANLQSVQDELDKCWAKAQMGNPPGFGHEEGIWIYMDLKGNIDFRSTPPGAPVKLVPGPGDPTTADTPFGNPPVIPGYFVVGIAHTHVWHSEPSEADIDNAKPTGTTGGVPGIIRFKGGSLVPYGQPRTGGLQGKPGFPPVTNPPPPKP